ncbi:glycosyltransferase, partial [Enterobacter cloacae complex sp.6701062]|uniref:glycosyltransferase n=1 Tax=Enterobacter cloacae complex sp.6701062 TaxID=3397177 RepID=UPI003AADE569
GPRELISNNVNGYIVENGNAQALAMKTIDLFSNDQEYDKMVINATESTTDYTPQIMYQEWNDIFNRRKELD